MGSSLQTPGVELVPQLSHPGVKELGCLYPSSRHWLRSVGAELGSCFPRSQPATGSSPQAKTYQCLQQQVRSVVPETVRVRAAGQEADSIAQASSGAWLCLESVLGGRCTRGKVAE